MGEFFDALKRGITSAGTKAPAYLGGDRQRIQSADVEYKTMQAKQLAAQYGVDLAQPGYDQIAILEQTGVISPQQAMLMSTELAQRERAERMEDVQFQRAGEMHDVDIASKKAGIGLTGAQTENIRKDTSQMDTRLGLEERRTSAEIQRIDAQVKDILAGARLKNLEGSEKERFLQDRRAMYAEAAQRNIDLSQPSPAVVTLLAKHKMIDPAEAMKMNISLEEYAYQLSARPTAAEMREKTAIELEKGLSEINVMESEAERNRGEVVARGQKWAEERENAIQEVKKDHLDRIEKVAGWITSQPSLYSDNSVDMPSDLDGVAGYIYTQTAQTYEELFEKAREEGKDVRRIAGTLVKQAFVEELKKVDIKKISPAAKKALFEIATGAKFSDPDLVKWIEQQEGVKANGAWYQDKDGVWKQRSAVSEEGKGVMSRLLGSKSAQKPVVVPHAVSIRKPGEPEVEHKGLQKFLNPRAGDWY